MSLFAAVVAEVSTMLTPVIAAVLSVATMVISVLVVLFGVYVILEVVAGEHARNRKLRDAERKIYDKVARREAREWVREHNEWERTPYEINDWNIEGFEDD